MTERRIVCIFLPSLPIERWRRQQERSGNALSDELAVVLSAAGPHGTVVHDLNRAAALAGVSRGARITDMQALCPGLQVVPADPGADAEALRQLMFWVRRWTPVSACDGPDALVLDATGTAHLFGGEAAILGDMQARLAVAGLTARVAIAPTWGAAWALARTGPERAVCQSADDILPLPLAALRLQGETLTLLARLGLRRIGDLAALPRTALMRRFARLPAPENPLIRLDQALGRTAEPLISPDLPPTFTTDAPLAEPVQDPTDWLPGLVKAVSDQLAAAHQGCRRLRLSVFRVDGERRDIHVATAAPSREAAHLLRLFQGRLERLDPGYGFDLIRLTAEATEPLLPGQPGLDGEADKGLDLARLIDRLTARFGPDAVHRVRLGDSHVPERSETRAAPLDAAPVPAPDPSRPLRLLVPPQEIEVLYAVPEGPPARFLWRRRAIEVIRHAGPERIAPEWWIDRPGTRLRDYYRIESAEGLRLWIYRDGVGGDGRGGAPRWFLQGIFA